MTKLEKPEKMRVNEARKKYYPNSFLMINCENKWEDYPNYVGEVIAYAPLKKKGPLVDLLWKINEEGVNGECSMINTKDILDGGSLLGEVYIAE